jgi:phage tail sheath gpL-like
MSDSIISEPNITLNIISADQNVENTPQKVLFVGQKTSAGSATSGALVQNIGNDGAEDDLFGENSILANMIRAARRINTLTQFDAIPLSDNGAGTAATGTLVISGTATEAGTFTFIVGSEENYSYEVSVADGDTAATVALALEALIDADEKVPVTAGVATATITFTCVHKGTLGNEIGLKLDGTVAGLTFTLTGMASGATDPVITSVFDVVNDLRYQSIVWPSTYTKSTVIDFLDDRFNSTNSILDGVAVMSINDTYANVLTALDGLNSKSLIINCEKFVNDTYYKGSSLLELDDVIAAQIAAIRSLRLTDNANLSRYVISTNGARDSFGGTAIASLPYANTPLYNLPLVAVDKGWTAEEISGINDAGGFVIGNNTAGNATIFGRVVTTYLTDSAANPDTSFKYLNYVDTISNVREYFFNNLRRRFAQSRLTSGDLVPNRAMANQQSIEAYLDSLYDDLSGVDYVLVQAGEAYKNYFKENRTVTLDLSTGTVTIVMKVPIVVQLRTIVGTIQLSFATAVV